MTFPSSLSETHRAVVQLLSKRCLVFFQQNQAGCDGCVCVPKEGGYNIGVFVGMLEGGSCDFGSRNLVVVLGGISDLDLRLL